MDIFDPSELYNLSKEPVDRVHFDKIREWLHRNKDDNARLKEAFSYRGENGETPLHVISHRDAPIDIIETFITYAPEAVKVPDSRGRLPLHNACWVTVSLNVVILLTESYPESVKVTDSSGCLPLHNAVLSAASLEVLTFLIESYPISVKVRDDIGRLPIHNACCRIEYWTDSLEVVSFLIESYPEGMYETNTLITLTPFDMLKGFKWAETKDKNGMLPLHCACKKGYSIPLIKVLLTAYPKATSVQDNVGKTPWKYLKETASHKDERGMLLLHRQAAYRKGLSVEGVNILFDAYPEAIRMQDNFGLLPLHYACLNEVSSLDIIMSLVKLYPESILVYCTSV
jgi:ankyrin repeat protein